jgi:hypothetical protein
VTSGIHSKIGGLVGWLEGGEVRDSQASGDISAGQGSFAGGLVGFTYNGGGVSRPNIARSFATGDISAAGVSTALCMGGLVGRAEYGVHDLDVADSYATGSVRSSGGSRIGGIIGCASRGSIETSYSTGLVDDAGHAHHGGFIGRPEDVAFAADYWDIDTSGQSKACPNRHHCSGVTGLSDIELKSGLPARFDPTVWAQKLKTNNGYPYLINNPPP